MATGGISTLTYELFDNSVSPINVRGSVILDTVGLLDVNYEGFQNAPITLNAGLLIVNDGTDPVIGTFAG